jgi:hypothetical protein
MLTVLNVTIQKEAIRSAEYLHDKHNIPCRSTHLVLSTGYNNPQV